MPENIKILLVSHKPFKIPNGEFFVPIHAGRSVALQASKDGKIDQADYDWMIENTIGDDTGDNISDKNRYYSECSALYWAWKNYDKLKNPDYIGLMHYRRHFVFNDEYFQKNLKDNWHKALCYINEDFIDEKYLKNIGLNDENIKCSCNSFDIIATKESEFKLIHGHDLRENYKNTIPGAKVEDFDLMLNVIQNKYPQYYTIVNKYINKDKKYLYQMFIMKRDLFFEYSEFLFDILEEIEQKINMDTYTQNGKRTLGYLAEFLLSFYIWYKQENGAKILRLGVTEVEFPYEKNTLQKMLLASPHNIFKYYALKFKSLFADKDTKQQLKEQFKTARRQYKSLKKLKLYIKENT